MADSVRTRKKSGWIASSWRSVGAVLIVIIAVVATLGLVFNQSHSFKTKVLVANPYAEMIQITISVDGVLNKSMDLEPGDYHVVGEWSVTEGRHALTIDYGAIDYVYAITYEHSFDRPSTKTVWIGIGPTISVRW